MADFYEQTETNGGSSFFMGLLAGAVLGAGLGLLMAPKSGAELRSQLSRRSRDLAETASNTYRRVTERGREIGEQVYDRARDAAGRTADQAERYARDVASSMPGTTTSPTETTGRG